METNRLDELRRKTLEIYNKLFSVILVIVLVIRLIEGNTFHALICLSCLLLILGIHYLNKKSFKSYSPSLYAFVLTSLMFAIAIYGSENKIFVTAYLTMHSASTIILIQKSLLRWIHLLCCFVVYVLMFFYLGFSFLKIIPFLLFLVCFSMVFMFYVSFLEKQELALGMAIAEAKNSNKKLENLNAALNSKNQELNTFNQIMSHDLKAPLRTISSFSSLLRKKIKFQEEENEEYFEYIEECAKKMDTMINELLMFNNLENEEHAIEDVPLQKVIETIKKSYKSELIKGKLILKTQELSSVRGNRPLVNTILSNLISNAVKYQPLDQEDHVPEIKIWTKENETTKNVFIQDNGIGINTDYIENLFIPFKRYHNASDYEGTGLGMSICKRVMEKLKGDIELVSSSDQGSLFKLTFPT